MKKVTRKIEYTRDEMVQLYALYLTNWGANKDLFVGKLKKHKVPKEDAELMWKSFDIVTEEFWEYFKFIYPKENIVQ